jgi:replicative superfamily II helicase
MNIETRTKIEKRIVHKIVRDALKMGYSISVDDEGDEYALKESTDIKKIMDALMNTETNNLVFHEISGKPVGEVCFVYGNSGYDVIADYINNADTNAIITGAEKLAEKLEEKYS